MSFPQAPADGSPSATVPDPRSTAVQYGLSEDQLSIELAYLDVDQSMAGARGVIVPYTIVLVVLLALMLPYSPLAASLVWAASFGTYILARRQMNRRYAAWSVDERKARLRPWHRTMVVTAMVFGAAWGSAALIAFPGSPLELRLLWTLMLTMVVAGAPRLLTMPQFVALVISLLVFTSIAWLGWGGWLGWPMSVALVVLGGLFTVMARHFHRGLSEKFELQLRNEHLARELERRNTQLEQTAQAKTLLLAAASHDLRQPVHALGLLMEVMQRTTEPQALKRRTTMAAECVESLSEMLTNLLDLTRMDSGSFPVSPNVAPLQDTLNDVLRIFRPIARRKGLMLHLGYTTLAVKTDPHLLRRMLFNLVSNAIKYTEEGSVRVRTELIAGEVVLHVEDTGTGIAPERLSDIFKDYVTSDDAASTRFDTGIGLGLGIVRRCAHLLGHEVFIHSEIGKGSRFSVHLGQPAWPQAVHAGSDRSDRLLPSVVAIVENDPVILEGLSEMLRQWGCQPVAGLTPGQVQGQLEQLRLKPQLILSDLHLGVSASGFEAVDALRRVAGNVSVPAVVLTGDLSPHHQQRAKAQGVRLEHKPLRPARLRKMLGEMLETQPS